MLARCVASAIAAAALLAALESAIAHSAAAWPLAFGLYAVVAFGIALLEATALWGLGGVPRLRRSDARADAEAAAGVLASAFALGVIAATTFVVQRSVAAPMENPTFAAATVAIGAAGATLLAAALFVAARRAARPAATLLPAPKALVAAAIVAAAAAAAVLPVLLRVEWRAVRLGPAVALGAFFALQAVIAWRAPLGGALAVALCIATLGALGLGARASSATAAHVAESGLALRPLLALAQRATDGDGDGFGALFGGGDCDDRRADTHPGARDLPGNGVDENCQGGDAAAPKSRPASGEAVTPPSARLADNVLIVTIDSLRADRLGVAGYARKLTPTLDRLAAEGAWFARAYAQAPNTPRSFPSIVTSRYPSQIAWQKAFANYSAIQGENETVFEALGRAGVAPVGVFSHHYFARERGLAQGFSDWSNDGALTIAGSNTDVAGPRIAARVKEKLRSLAASGGRFALWTHLFEPHGRYVDHAEFPVRATGIPGLVERYDYEIAFVDRIVGELLRALEETGLARSTAVLVFADHGEAFGEHRARGARVYFHGQTLYEEVLRVPLLLRVPGVAPRRVDTRAMLIDLAPTLCELLGVPAPATFSGRSLVPAMLGQPMPPRPVHAELLPAPAWNEDVRARIDGDHKILYRVSESAFELYDLAKDPGERVDLWGRDRELSDRMRAGIVGWMESEL